jgi:CHAD domain-containing protein
MKGGPALTAGPFLAAKLRSLDDRLRELVPRAVVRAPDAEAVHDLRVALRRARTILEAGASVLGRFHCGEVRRALRDVQRATGAVRDEEVLLDLVETLGSSDRSDRALAARLEPWIVVRRRRERGLRRGLTRAIEAGGIERSCRLLDALLAFPVDPSLDKPLAKLARRSVAKASRRVERLRESGANDPRALHELRIAYKRLRYVVETFTEALPEGLGALAPRAARMQNRLGAVHDIDVVVASVKRARALSPDSRGPLLEALAWARVERVAAYAAALTKDSAAQGKDSRDGKDAGADDAGTGIHLVLDQAAGTEALRKTSTR